MIVGISGLAGSGKDTCADFLVRNHDFVKVSFADPMKRICMDVYGFSFDQLWGPSSERNKPDARLPRKHSWRPNLDENRWVCVCCNVACRHPDLDESPCYLTPRFALQQLGSEWGRVCREDTWVEYALNVARRIEEGDCIYAPERGLATRPAGASSVFKGGILKMTVNRRESVFNIPGCDVVIPDVRFENEIAGLIAKGAKLIRVVRTGAGLDGAAGAHRSEKEQGGIPDDRFDLVIENDGTLKDLEDAITAAVLKWSAL